MYKLARAAGETQERFSVIGANVGKRCDRPLKSCECGAAGVDYGVLELTVMWRDTENAVVRFEPSACSAGEVRNKRCTCLIGVWFYPGRKLLLRC